MKTNSFAHLEKSDLLARFVRLDNNATAMTVQEEAARLAALDEMWAALVECGMTDAELEEAHARFWKSRRDDNV